MLSAHSEQVGNETNGDRHLFRLDLSGREQALERTVVLGVEIAGIIDVKIVVVGMLCRTGQIIVGILVFLRENVVFVALVIGGSMIDDRTKHTSAGPEHIVAVFVADRSSVIVPDKRTVAVFVKS